MKITYHTSSKQVADNLTHIIKSIASAELAYRKRQNLISQQDFVLCFSKYEADNIVKQLREQGKTITAVIRYSEGTIEIRYLIPKITVPK